MNYQAIPPFGGGCLQGHPYAYGGGKYCCSKFEFPEWPEKGQSGHIGRSFGNCRGNYAECLYGDNCVDLLHIQNGKSSFLKASEYMTSVTSQLSQSIVI